jgi:citrate lyase alpha subunit
LNSLALGYIASQEGPFSMELGGEQEKRVSGAVVEFTHTPMYILINRIMHYLNKNNLMNQNEFGFTPGKSTTDAILAVTDYIEERIKQRDITILMSRCKIRVRCSLVAEHNIHVKRI